MAVRGNPVSAFRHGPSRTPRVCQGAARARAAAVVRGLRCRLERASRSPFCRSCSRPCTRISTAVSSACWPEDADARDAAEAAGWFIGPDRVALLPGRGVRWGSGLEPPPHLVGERARALDVLEGGGLVCASATALAEGVPPRAARSEPVRLDVGAEPGLDGLAESLALAGYERVDRAEERGQFAVRGGLVDVFPTTGQRAASRRALRRRDRAGPRLLALHAAGAPSRRGGRDLSGRRATRRPDGADPSGRRFRARHARGSARSRAGARSRARFRLAAGRGAARLDGGELSARSRSRAAPSSTRSRKVSRSRSRPSGRRSPHVGSPRPRRSSRASFAAVTGSSSHFPTPVRRCARRTSSSAPTRACSTPARSSPSSRSFSSPSRRRAEGSSGASSGSFSYPTHRSFVSGRRAPTAASAGRLPPSRTCGRATSSSTRTTASGSCSASRRRRSPASRATTSSSPSGAMTASMSRTSNSARSRSTSARTRVRLRSRSSAARPGRTSGPAPVSPCGSSPPS